MAKVKGVSSCQGRIELPKAARGHATYVNGKIQHGRLYLKSVTPFMAIQCLRMLNLHMRLVVNHIHTQ